MLERIIQGFNEAILDTDREGALRVIHEALELGVTPEEVIFQVVIPAIEGMVTCIGHKFEANLAQHFLTSQIAAEVTEEMLARFETPPLPVGRMVIGTAEGDLHSLGKRIVMGCLKAQMIEVFDLGVNVPPERFVDEALARDASVIGISAMMVHTARGDNGCLAVRRLIRERGLQQRMRIIVGGAPYRFDPGMYRAVGADAWADNGLAAGRIISGLIREVER